MQDSVRIGDTYIALHLKPRMYGKTFEWTSVDKDS